MSAFILFSMGCWLAIWGMRIYAKSRDRHDNDFGRLLEDAKKDKLTKDNLPNIRKTIIIGVISSIILLIAISIKYDHFLQCSRENYRGEYIWIAPAVIIFNIANMISSFCAIKKIKKQF